MKTLVRLLLLLSLVAAIFAGRWLWFYGNGRAYQTPQIAEIQADKVVGAPTLDHRAFADEPVAGNGHVLIDLAHHNNLTRNDLIPLQSRLEARGVTVAFFDGDVTLRYALYQATALVVLAPSVPFTDVEQKAIAAFVQDGGRLFLAADPTRPVLSADTTDAETAAFFPTSAVPAINSVANLFTVTYFDDYLYNLAENVGNYRNVALAPADARTPLTQEVETVVFFATHSMRSTGTALFKDDAAIASTVRTGETDLPAAVITADERVLALGDVTFLTAPYHTIADNDRFLSHIADWLAEDTRVRNALEDFPYLFSQQTIDLVQLSGDRIDPRLIAKGGTLQTYFTETGRSLAIRTDVVPDHDALLLGLFSDVPTVQELLAQNGITLTTVAAANPAAAVPSNGGQTATDATGMEQYLEIPAMGTLSVKGITLFIVDCNAARCSISIVAETAESVASAVERLANHNLVGCAQAGAITLCATEGLLETQPKATEPAPTKRILIISVEAGEGGVRTSAADFVGMLDDIYAVTLWTIPDDGQPTRADLEGYNVYIIDSGDYAGSLADSPAFRAIDRISSGNVLLVGAQPLPIDTAEFEYAPINDLVVADTPHPLLEGLTAGELITLLPSESSVPAMIISGDDMESAILLTRGPNSPSTGSPALIAAVDETSDINRIVVAAFPFYRLPESIQRTLALNIAAWLMADGD